MKKLKLFTLLGLGFLATFGIVLGSTLNHGMTPVYAEPDDTSEPAADPSSDPVEDPAPDPVEETFECLVFWAEKDHGKITVDKDSGHVGDIVTITLNPDIFYLTDYVKVNGVSLVEDENIRDTYKFALVEGNNEIEAHFVIDEELLGKMSTMVEEATNKDWTNLFSVKNVITLVAFVLDGGILIAIVRYFVKDKRLADKVEKKVETTVEKVVPEATKEVVLNAIKELIAPYFSQLQLGFNDIQEMLVVFCRCFALMQENTPEARIAITKELASLKLSDKASINMIEEKINNFIKDQGDKMAELVQKLGDIKTENQEIVENSEEKAETPVDDGTQI